MSDVKLSFPSSLSGIKAKEVSSAFGRNFRSVLLLTLVGALIWPEPELPQAQDLTFHWSKQLTYIVHFHLRIVSSSLAL